MELFWELSSESWIQKTIAGKHWLGSNTIRMNDMSILPFGLYRVLVLDKAGERDSREFNLSKSVLKKL